MLRLEHITISYDKKNFAVDDISLNVEQGEFIGIIGSSGSGKSSILKSINLLVKPIKGKIYMDDIDVIGLNNSQLRAIRREIGFVFQDYNLIDRSSVLDNVLAGRLGYKSSLQSMLGIFTNEEYERAEKALIQVGLGEKMFERADQLSGGQRSRELL